MKKGISVIIPTYNRAPFLEKSIESVYSQTILPNEVIIVDDGSVDNTASLIKKLQEKYKNLIYIYIQNAGSAVARNRALSVSKYNMLAFLDSDDLWKPHHLEEALEAFKIFPESCFVFANYDVTSKRKDISDNFISKYCANRGFVHRYPNLIEKEVNSKYFLLNASSMLNLALMRKDSIATSGLVFRKDKINAHIFFDNILRIGQDIDFVLQYLYFGGQPVYIDSIHSDYCIHDENIVMIKEESKMHDISPAEVAKLKIYVKNFEKRFMYCSSIEEYRITRKCLAEYYWLIALGLNDNGKYEEAHHYFTLSFQTQMRYDTLKHILVYVLFGYKGKKFIMDLLKKFKNIAKK